MQTPDIGRPPVNRQHERVVEGVVVHGYKPGRLLGFPTANIAGDSVILEDGVWAGTVQVDPWGDGREYLAARSRASRTRRTSCASSTATWRTWKPGPGGR